MSTNMYLWLHIGKKIRHLRIFNDLIFSENECGKRYAALFSCDKTFAPDKEFLRSFLHIKYNINKYILQKL